MTYFDPDAEPRLIAGDGYMGLVPIGTKCVACHRNLVKAPVAITTDEDGVGHFICPWCGAKLRCNRHCFIFAEASA